MAEAVEHTSSLWRSVAVGDEILIRTHGRPPDGLIDLAFVVDAGALVS